MASSNPRPVILLVEDDVDISMLVTSVLEDVDCDVVSARDGERAVSLAQEQAVDLVLLDARLPLMSGEEVATRLQDIGDAPPIVLFSASADLAMIAARIGAVGYIHKPFDLDDLTATVQRALGRTAVVQ
jgi:DNA-binding response OmpR family regulator